jgi:hypothetical protein
MGASSPASSLRPCTHNDDSNGLKRAGALGLRALGLSLAFLLGLLSALSSLGLRVLSALSPLGLGLATPLLVALRWHESEAAAPPPLTRTKTNGSSPPLELTRPCPPHRNKTQTADILTRSEIRVRRSHRLQKRRRRKALLLACPQGVDLYFENTADSISDAVYEQLALGARVVVCGTASIASWDPPAQGPRLQRHLLVKRALMSGLFDYASRCEEAMARLASWVREGKVRYREDIQEGIECCRGAIADLYRGENLGKR